MIYREVVGDLFTAPQGYCLAHCISGDFALSAGIAVQFDEKFNMKKRLKHLFDCEIASPLCVKVDNVYNLVTKDIGYQRPTYDSLYNSLENMKKDVVDNSIKKIAMPKIGCGLDGLNWNIVKAMIKEVFDNTDTEIVVYIREDDSDVENVKKDKISSGSLYQLRNEKNRNLNYAVCFCRDKDEVENQKGDFSL